MDSTVPKVYLTLLHGDFHLQMPKAVLMCVAHKACCKQGDVKCMTPTWRKGVPHEVLLRITLKANDLLVASRVYHVGIRQPSNNLQTTQQDTY